MVLRRRWHSGSSSCICRLRLSLSRHISREGGAGGKGWCCADRWRADVTGRGSCASPWWPPTDPAALRFAVRFPPFPLLFSCQRVFALIAAVASRTTTMRIWLCVSETLLVRYYSHILCRIYARNRTSMIVFEYAFIWFRIKFYQISLPLPTL